jgi:D-xylose transport system permease protein
VSTLSSTPIGTGQEGSVTDQLKAYVSNVRNGNMGSLPAIGGFLVLSILFSFLNPYFLTKLNFANLFTQAATLMMLAMALVFVILIAEIDLSAGVTSGVAMAVFVLLVNTLHVNWILGLLAALVTGLAIGSFIGYFVAKVGVPSFVVTLGLFLGFQGLQLVLLGDGGLYRIETPQILSIMNDNLPVWGGWLMLVVALIISAVTSVLDRRRRRIAGVANRPIAIMLLRLGAIAIGGGIVVGILNQDRSVSILPISGVPIVVPIALVLLWAGTFLLDRTRFGRHLYAVGGNPEAARRAGIKVASVRIVAFILCSTLSVVSGVFDASRIGSVDSGAGKAIVLSGVAAAVVGGVSLFGGRGRLVHAAIGAFVIAVIDNGLGLLGLPAGVNFLVTGGVLILAATVDAVSRKRGGTQLSRL